MDKDVFKQFFQSYSKNVDNANRVGFWKLSDEIIKQIIFNHIANKDDDSTIILDAGGGTGRWICELSDIYKSNFVLYDLSEDMLERAKVNISKKGIADRVNIVKGSLTNMSNINSDSIDYIISIYSPISFVYEKEKAFKEMFRILKPSGKIMIMGHGFYNAIYSKVTNYLANPEELDKLVDMKMVKWAEYVPELNVFSKEIMESDLKQAGFRIQQTYGVPVFVQPGSEDFDPENKKLSSISKALQNPEFFNKVFEIEMKYNSRETISNRGVNIFSVGVKDGPK